MSLGVLQLSGWIDGEHPINVSGTDHVAGQPAKLTSTGWNLAIAPAGVLGLFKNDMVVDITGGPSAADTVALGFAFGSVVMGVNKVRMSPGLLQDGTPQSPFAFPPSGADWAIGDLLFISSTGFWDNAAAAAGDAPFGMVMTPPLSATGFLEGLVFTNVADESQGIPDGSITTAKLANLAVTTAKLDALAVTTAKIAAGAVTTTELGAAAVTAGKIALFASAADSTATGASQNIAHGLASAPSVVWFTTVAGHDGAGAAGIQVPTIVPGVHDATNIKVTVTAGAKFRAYAIL